MFIYWLYYTSRLHHHQLKLPQITILNLSLYFQLKFMQSSFKDWVDWFGNFGEGGAGFEPIGKHCFRINKGKMRTWKVCQIYKIKLPKVGIGTHLPLPRSTESAHVSFLFHQRSTLIQNCWSFEGHCKSKLYSDAHTWTKVISGYDWAFIKIK